MLSGTIHTHIFFHFIFRWPLSGVAEQSQKYIDGISCMGRDC